MQAQTNGAGRSPLVQAPTSPVTLSTHTYEYGNLRLAGEAGDHTLAVRAVTGARGACD